MDAVSWVAGSQTFANMVGPNIMFKSCGRVFFRASVPYSAICLSVQPLFGLQPLGTLIPVAFAFLGQLELACVCKTV